MNKVPLLTEAEAAAFLKFKPQTLRKDRSNKTKLLGLPFVKIGRSVRYRQEDLDRYIAQRTQGTGE